MANLSPHAPFCQWHIPNEHVFQYLAVNDPSLIHRIMIADLFFESTAPPPSDTQYLVIYIFSRSAGCAGSKVPRSKLGSTKLLTGTCNYDGA